MINRRHPNRGKVIFKLTDDEDPLTLWSGYMNQKFDEDNKTTKSEYKSECLHNFVRQNGFRFDQYICTICGMSRPLEDNEK